MAMGAKVRLENPTTGVVMDFGLPLPPVIAKQVENGYLRPPVPPLEDLAVVQPDTSAAAGGAAPGDGQGPSPQPAPRGNASLQAWVEYAVSQGMPAAEAAGLSRDEIRARFTDPGFDPDAPPRMD
jgi:hypothetical protein